MKGTSIKAWRKYRRMTQEDLAARLGMTPGNLSKLERGRIPYGQMTLELAAEALQCDEADLLRPFVEPGGPDGGSRLSDLLTRLTAEQQGLLEQMASEFARQNEPPRARGRIRAAGE